MTIRVVNINVVQRKKVISKFVFELSKLSHKIFF